MGTSSLNEPLHAQALPPRSFLRWSWQPLRSKDPSCRLTIGWRKQLFGSRPTASYRYCGAQVWLTLTCKHGFPPVLTPLRTSSLKMADSTCDLSCSNAKTPDCSGSQPPRPSENIKIYIMSHNSCKITVRKQQGKSFYGWGQHMRTLLKGDSVRKGENHCSSVTKISPAPFIY